jgi:Amidohydrolase
MSGDAEGGDMYPRGPVQPGGRLTTMLDRFPNLWCDLSAESGFNALSRDPENARAFLMQYRDRCLFGRDYFDDRLRPFLLGLGLPDDALAAIFSGNALRLIPDAPVATGGSEAAAAPAPANLAVRQP